ncbi:MAG: hypothetical protein Q9191_003986 [Dirinaria sp. TL-2023a]
MATSYPFIPLRNSSLDQWNEKEFQIKVTRERLNRNILNIAMEKLPIEHQMVMIEQLENEAEAQRHQKEGFRCEYEQRLMTEEDHRKAHRDANIRLISLGAEIWQERKKHRMLEEAANELPALGSDTEGAFTAALLKLYKDQTQYSKRSKIQTQMKGEAIARYGTDQDKSKKLCQWCAISHAYHDKENVTAGQIVPFALGSELVEYICGPGAGLRLNTADNCLLMESKLERQFELGHFVLLPVDLTERPIKRWKVQITNDDALKNQVGNAREQLRDYQGRVLVWKNEERPAARFLYYHFVVTLLRINHYKSQGSAEYSLRLSNEKPFATMGPYFRKSVLLALARQAGDVGEVTQRMIKEGEAIHDDDTTLKLGDKESDEIARRILKEFGTDSEDSEDEEED